MVITIGARKILVLTVAPDGVVSGNAGDIGTYLGALYLCEGGTTWSEIL